MKYPKFIVLKDLQGNIEIRFGLVEFHSYLILPEDKKFSKKCIGGGLIELVDSKSEIWFYGHSDDFGRVEDNILNNIKLNSQNFYELQYIAENYFHTKVKDFLKFKFVVKDF